jgi:hypothetical protein
VSLQARDYVQTQYLIHIVGYGLGLMLLLLTGSSTVMRWSGALVDLCWLYVPLDDARQALRIAVFDIRIPLPLATTFSLIEPTEP